MTAHGIGQIADRLSERLSVPVSRFNGADAVQVEDSVSEDLSDHEEWNVPVGLGLQAMWGAAHAINLMPDNVRHAERRKFRAALVGVATVTGLAVVGTFVSGVDSVASNYILAAARSDEQVQMARQLLAQRDAIERHQRGRPDEIEPVLEVLELLRDGG